MQGFKKENNKKCRHKIIANIQLHAQKLEDGQITQAQNGLNRFLAQPGIMYYQNKEVWEGQGRYGFCNRKCVSRTEFRKVSTQHLLNEKLITKAYR